MSGIAWNWHANRQQELARQLARTRRVVFVEPPGLLPSWRLHDEELGPSLVRVAPPTLLPLGRFLPPVNRVNRRFAARALRRYLGDGDPGRLLWIDEDLAAPIIGRLGESARVYDGADLDWTFTRAWNRGHLRRALRSAVRKADLVLASSPELGRDLARAGGSPVELPNACDPDHFRPEGPEAEALASLGRPRLGYVGALDERAFDAELVASVARLRPDWSLVLLGGSVPSARRAFRGLANVHLLGPVAYADVPSYLRGFDVCLIPYRTKGRAAYVQPKKLYEYLAVGKPVVATALPALGASDAPHHAAVGPADFVAAVEAALAERTPEAAARRRAVACANTWEARGRDLRSLVDALEASPA